MTPEWMSVPDLNKWSTGKSHCGFCREKICFKKLNSQQSQWTGEEGNVIFWNLRNFKQDLDLRTFKCIKI